MGRVRAALAFVVLVMVFVGFAVAARLAGAGAGEGGQFATITQAFGAPCLQQGTPTNGQVWTYFGAPTNAWHAGAGAVSGVSQIVAGTGISVSPGGGTGVVTVTNTSPGSSVTLQGAYNNGSAGTAGIISLTSSFGPIVFKNVTGSDGLLVTNNVAASGVANGIDLVADGTPGTIAVTDYGVVGETNRVTFLGRSAEGSFASPTATQSGDALVTLSGIGYGASGFASTSRGRVGVYAAENWTNSAQGTVVDIYTTIAGTLTTSPGIQFSATSGNFIIQPLTGNLVIETTLTSGALILNAVNNDVIVQGNNANIFAAKYSSGSNASVIFGANVNVGWSSDPGVTGANPDASFVRQGVGILGLIDPNSLTSSTEMRVMNTTDNAFGAPMNSEFFSVNWASNVCRMGPSKTGTGTTRTLAIQENGSTASFWDPSLNAVLGGTGAALGTTATNGWAYLAFSAGQPTGTPANLTGSYAGAVPVDVDTTNGKLWAYYSGAWNSLSGSAGTTTLEQAYTNGGAGPQVITLTTSGQGVSLATTALMSNALNITNNPGSSNASDGIDVTVGNNSTGFGINVNTGTSTASGVRVAPTGGIGTAFDVSAGSLASSSIFFGASGTWNGSGQTFDGIMINVTNTASAAGSRLLTMQLSNLSKFAVDSLGNTIINDTSSALSTSATSGFLYIPTCAGVPSGTPTFLQTGTIPLVLDSVSAVAYVYSSSSWIALGSGASTTTLQQAYTNGGAGGGAVTLTTSGGALALTQPVGGQGLMITGGTQTTSQVPVSITQTWNASAVSFEGVICNITNTTSAAGSRVLDVQSSGTSEWSVDVLGNMYQTGLVSKYDGVATAAYGHPAIYASGALTGQTGNVASVAAYTATASGGLFVIKGDMTVTAASSLLLQMEVTYTDEQSNAITLPLNFCNATTGLIGAGAITTTGTYPGIPVTIRAKASTAITVKTVGVTTGTYDAYATISQEQ
jgi:hypothetical protein